MCYFSVPFIFLSSVFKKKIFPIRQSRGRGLHWMKKQRVAFTCLLVFVWLKKVKLKAKHGMWKQLSNKYFSLVPIGATLFTLHLQGNQSHRSSLAGCKTKLNSGFVPIGDVVAGDVWWGPTSPQSSLSQPIADSLSTDGGIVRSWYNSGSCCCHHSTDPVQVSATARTISCPSCLPVALS